MIKVLYTVRTGVSLICMSGEWRPGERLRGSTFVLIGKPLIVGSKINLVGEAGIRLLGRLNSYTRMWYA